MPEPQGGGFWDFVKSPARWRAERRRVQRAEAAPPASGAEVARLVAVLGERKLTSEEMTRLRKAGAAVVPPVLDALRDPAFVARRYGESVLAGSALETALDLVQPFAPAGLAEALRHALRHEAARVRQYAVYTLGRCGTDEAVGALRGGLADPDQEVRQYALMGLAFLHRTGRGSPAFRRQVFDAVVPLLDDPDHGPAGHAPKALLALDPDRATSLLTGGQVFRADNPRIDDVLQAFHDFQIPVPGDQLRALLSGLKPKAGSFPFDWAYGRGLILLARAEGPRATEVIQDALGWGKERVREFAAEAVGIAAGAGDAYRVVGERYEKDGVAGLAEPQLHYLTLWLLDAEVRNGGFAQYFFNSSGDLAEYAVAAAAAVGAPDAAQIIGEAVALFGEDGPESDRDERHAQLARIDEDDLERLTEAYYSSDDDLRVLLPLYAARHPEFFRPPPA
jgi:HEAT repeat protein